jgi:hypothetical protein
LKIQIIGIPLRIYRRFSVDQVIENWTRSKAPIELRFLNSTENYRSTITDGLVRSVRKNVADGFSRIIAYPTTHTKLLKREFKFDCRLSLLDFKEDADSITWDFFSSALDDAIDVEVLWDQQVGPKDVRHALFLPPPSFVPANQLKRFWDECDVYDRARIRQAAAVIEDFQREHRKNSAKGQCWMDSDERYFHIDRSRHGRAAAERDGQSPYRFAFLLPSGFHFDVERADDAEFWLTDLFGTRHKAAHLNATCWGQVY